MNRGFMNASLRRLGACAFWLIASAGGGRRDDSMGSIFKR